MTSDNQPQALPSSLPLPPGFNTELATSTFLSAAPSADEPNSEGDDFIRECLDWLDKWAEDFAESDKSLLAPCLLVFDPSKLPSEVIPGLSRHVGFKHTLALSIGSRVYSCTSNLTQVYSINATITDSSSALLLIESLKLNHTYAVVWLPNESVALVIEPGGNIETPKRIRMKRQSGVIFDFTTLDYHLETFYTDHVATHEGDCDIWQYAGKREIRQFAERLICKSLHGFFRHSVLPRSARVGREIQTYMGREDIQILRTNASHELETAILELKVLRASHSVDDALDWAKKGVDQVRDYSETDDQVKEKFVCIYDGRTNDEPMPEGVQYAAQHKVKWRRYFMTTPTSPKIHSGYLT